MGFGASFDRTAYFRMAVCYLNIVFAVAKIRCGKGRLNWENRVILWFYSGLTLNQYGVASP